MNTGSKINLCCLIYLGLNLITVYCERLRYDNYHVYQLTPKSIETIAVLEKMETNHDSIVFLDAPHYLNRTIKAVVSPKIIASFESQLNELNVNYALLEDDAQSQLNDEVVADANRRDNSYTWQEYHQLNDTYNWMQSLAEQYPKEVSVLKVGRTYEARDILALKISYGTGKQSIFIEAGIHAREWIGPATATFILYQLLTSDNKEVRRIAESYDWYIVPHVNPDGYVYTHTTDRMWRKTRTPYGFGCFGADPNRNWNFHWAEVGTSNNPCSDIYAGPVAFSEIETRTLAKFITSIKDDILLYISIHSYSQLLLFPYGHTAELPANYEQLKQVFHSAVKAVSLRYGTHYTGGNIYDAIYPAAGASGDWAYGVANISYSYCYELRPAGNAFWMGFKLPADQIKPTGEETLDSILAMIKEIEKVEGKQ